MSATGTAARRELGFRLQRPEPSRFWIRFRPRTWAGPLRPWLDLATGAMGAAGRPVRLELERSRIERLDDTVYLPPVPRLDAAARLALAERLAGLGVPVVLQLAPGEPQPDLPVSVVYDPLAVLLERRLDALDALPEGAAVAWPLVATRTDGEAVRSAALERLAAAGVACVQPVAVRLEPAVKRRLAGDDEAAFHRLFHGEPPSERAFAAEAAWHGFRPFLPRPEAPGGRRAANRRVAASLGLVAELWLRTGRPEGRAQELFAAARHADAAEHDLAVLAREGNLELLEWLDAETLELVREVVAGGRPRLLDDLESDYLAGNAAAAN